jgi:hypothetical protein
MLKSINTSTLIKLQTTEIFLQLWKSKIETCESVGPRKVDLVDIKFLRTVAGFILVQLKGNRDTLNQLNTYNLNKE